MFGEEALIGNHHGHAWVLGLAFERDELAVPTVPGVSYTYNVPALFAQDEFAPTTWLKFAGSARVDAHNDYGTFLSPRLSALLHPPASEWTVRGSVGGGFAARHRGDLEIAPHVSGAEQELGRGAGEEAP